MAINITAIPLSAIGESRFVVARSSLQHTARDWIHCLFGVAVLNGIV